MKLQMEPQVESPVEPTIAHSGVGKSAADETFTFRLNGEPHTAHQLSTVAEICTQCGVGDRGYAVERNGEIVPRSRWATVRLAPGDIVEIIHMVGGG